MSSIASKVSSFRHVIKRVLPTQPQHLYDVITDVDSYAQFVPQCKSSRILRRSECGTIFDASLCVTMTDTPPFNWIEEEYVSRVRMKGPSKINTNSNYVTGSQHPDADGVEWIVEAKSIKSRLFHGLTSRWRLTESALTRKSVSNRTTLQLGDNKMMDSAEDYSHTNVEFEIEMKVQDPIIVTVLDEVLVHVAETQVDAFEKRCIEIHNYEL